MNAFLIVNVVLSWGLLFWTWMRRRHEARRALILSWLQDRVQDTAPNIANAIGVSVGSLYGTLRRLEREGWLVSYEAEGGPGRGYRPKRVYALSAVPAQTPPVSPVFLRALKDLNERTKPRTGN